MVAALLVAGAMYFSDGSSSKPGDSSGEEPVISVSPVTADDHILGNPDAPIKIVDFSDIDCPFCARFHVTMNSIMDEYGESGEVAWVYRHFPLDQLHPEARRKAEASECVAELGGDGTFWQFLDILYERNETLSDLSSIAGEVGVDVSAFESCLSSGRYSDAVQEDFDDARAAGGQGTPHSIVLVEGEIASTIPGAQSFETVKVLLDDLIEKLN